MSLSRRTARRSVRALGVTAASAALALGAAGYAFADDIDLFSASASCVGGKGVITVTDKDPSGAPATVTVFLENNNADVRQVGAQEVKGTAKGATISFAEEWEPSAVYRIHIKSGEVNKDIDPFLTAPAKACQADDTASPSGTPSGTPSATASASPSESADTESPAPSEPSAGGEDTPAPAGNDVQPAAQQSNLAETGASSNTGLIVGVAALLVVLGGGAVFFGLRRRGSGDR
ncbi:LAETG motif-containing sortase-dependent surface protein [Streptomyces sp. CAI-85]|uniref:LAETG motif-containing sortase-dependent surface protein n=1 Tax=Streptomyces sp. CAI-85 TaxID=1472662 RepID=UPI001587CFC9|nr:LAETG motif-containing sortase-dependent surface protein [Streptomyces sp. CAI-85]NUV65121.1 LPXTG cell wall anchor domain-containing protein [Streptomyces sp. CAI-85]